MKNRTKLVNIDILKAMQTIVDSHTRFYKTDFEYDIETIKKSAAKPEQADRTFVWMCRTHGTWCLKEKNVFIRDSHEYSVFTYYAQTKDILAFLVEVNSFDNGIVMGNLYNAGYKELYGRVAASAVPAGNTVIQYEGGRRILPPKAHFNSRPDEKLGKFVSFEILPESPGQLEMVLTDEKRNRNKFKEDYEVIGYELYECPASPAENGKYYAKTPLLGQAENIARNARTSGKQLFIKAVCSDGKKRYC